MSSNSKKSNNVVSFETLFNELCECKTKFGLVNAMVRNGYMTTTKPTTTENVNDLYIQVNDGSRIWLRKNRIDFLSVVNTCNELFGELTPVKSSTTELVEKSDNGCKYRSHRIECIPKTADAFNIIMSYLVRTGAILPTPTN